MLDTILNKAGEKFIIELGKICARTAVTTITAIVAKKAIDDLFLKVKGKDDTKDKEEKEGDNTKETN